MTKHPEFVEGCFGCKVGTLQLNTGDANGALISGGMTNKKWDKELSDYRAARAQGIQPDSTKSKDIRKAVDLSNKYGKPYDGGAANKGIL